MLQDKEDSFSISQLPKRKDRHLNHPNYLKPKMRYKIEKADRNIEEGAQGLHVSLGYGRKFTGYHSIRS